MFRDPEAIALNIQKAMKSAYLNVNRG